VRIRFWLIFIAKVFAVTEASPVIKGYSPELIVHPYESSKIDFINHPESTEKEMDKLKSKLNVYHSLVMGCGFGISGDHKKANDPHMLSHLIKHAVSKDLTLVGDADFMWYL